MDRSILHLDLDTFFVSVERLENRALIGKPVIVGGTSDRGVVASCSYEARQFGVHSAMSSRLAKQLCPEAIFVKGDYDAYSRFSGMVTDILKDSAPLVEKASIDEHYCDLTGMDKFIGCAKWATELRQRIIKETRLPISFGLSVNKTVSKVATGQAKPNGQLHIIRTLREQKKLLAAGDHPDAPAFVRDQTPLKTKGRITTLELRNEFRRAPKLSILLDNSPLIACIRQGVETSIFIYQKGDLLWGPGDPAGSIEISENAFVYTMAHATELGIWPRKPKEPPPEITVPGTGGKSRGFRAPREQS